MELEKEFFQYVINATRSANQEIEENIRVDKGGDFIVNEIYGTATSTYRIQFRDIAGVWQEGQINNTLIIGVITLPFILPVPRRIRRNTLLYYRITDTSGSANTIQIILKGYNKNY